MMTRRLHAKIEEMDARMSIVIVFTVAVSVRAVAYAMNLLALPMWPANWPGSALGRGSMFYIQANVKYILDGLLPYSNFAFNYGPLYLYSMAPFYIISPWLSYVPTVVADAATSVAIYLTVKHVSARQNMAMVAGLAYALLPFAVINEGYLWMSSQPMTFFIILAMYFSVKKSQVAALCTLAVAALFKQEALFVLLPLVVISAVTDWHKTVKGVVASAGVFLAGIGPFLAASPLETIYSLTYGRLVNLGSAPGYGAPSTVLQTIPNSCAQGLINITSASTGLMCGTIVNPSAFAAYELQSRIFGFILVIRPILNVLDPVLLGIFAISLLAVRKSPVALQLAAAFSSLAFLVLFSYLVHSLFAYYFLPVYALMLAASMNRRMLEITVAATTLAMFVPDGIMQLVISMFGVFAMTVAESMRLERVRLEPTCHLSGLSFRSAVPVPDSPAERQ